MGKGIVKLGEGKWAVKDGNLLAAKETNGRFKNTEFTVSRGTRASYVGRDGLIKESNLQDVNLVNNGDFSNGSTDWETEGFSQITVGTYQGRENVAEINIYNTATISRIRQPFTYVNGTIYKIVVNVYLESGSFRVDSSDTFVSGDFLSTTSTGSWQTLTAYFNAISSGSNYIWLRSLSEVSEFYVQDISIQEVKTDTPRIDFTDNTDGHLLLEPQSTNLLPYSEDFSEWNQVSNSVVTDNFTTSPDGTQNASKFTFDGTTNGRLENALTVTSGNQYTFSVWLKNDNLADTTQVWLAFSTFSQGEYVTVTNEWQRFTTTQTADGTTEYPRIQTSEIGSIFAWGAQFEEKSYPTSYIPTNGSTVTRDADTSTNAGSSADFNSEEGVLYAEIAALANDGLSKRITLADGSISNRVSLELDETANKIKAFITLNGASEILEYTATNLLQFNKIAIKWKANDFAIWFNGSAVVTETAESRVPTGLTELVFEGGNSLSPFYGKVKAIRVYKDASIDLATLTSL